MGQTHKNKGVALISALSFLVITGIFVGIALLVSVNNKVLTVNTAQSFRAQLAAEAGLEQAVFNSYYQLDFKTNEELNLETLRQKLDENKIYAGASTDKLHEFGQAKEISNTLADGSGYLLTIRRIDLAEQTIIRLDSLGFIAEKDKPQAIRRISQDLVFYNDFPDSASFAVLANKSNGIFQNSIISSLETAYDDGNLLPLKNPSEAVRAQIANNYRIKIASLENILDPAKDINSLVTGTIYTRGSDNLLAARNLKGIPFKEINSEASSVLSNKASESFSNLDIEDCNNGCDKKNAAFYKNYVDNNYPDSEVLVEFPLAINDTNSDQLISDFEWAKAISEDKNLGSIKGGKKRLYNQAIKNADSASLSSKLPNGIAANAVLAGSSTNPLVITGSVYFDGDVVISGKVTGSGRIIARGNIYIVADISYACDDNSQDFKWLSSAHTSCDYSKPKDLPKFALLAAKNIITGDYQSYKYSNEAAFDFADKQTSELSYLGQQMAIYNQLEYEQKLAKPSYKAKFYSFFEDKQVYRCTSCSSYAGFVEIEEGLLKSSSIIAINPKDNWLAVNKADDFASAAKIHQFWQKNVESNFGRGIKPDLQIDALLHANHGIFANLFAQSKTKAQMQINGSIFASEISISAEGQLAIYFDSRLSNLINLNDTELKIKRTNYRLIKQNSQINYEAMAD